MHKPNRTTLRVSGIIIAALAACRLLAAISDALLPALTG